MTAGTEKAAWILSILLVFILFLYLLLVSLMALFSYNCWDDVVSNAQYATLKIAKGKELITSYLIHNYTRIISLD